MASAVLAFTHVSDQDNILTLINSKQPKEDYLQINSQDIVPLKTNIITQGGTFNGATSTEMSYLEGVHTYVQDQLDGKQPTGDYALKTDLTQYLPLSGGDMTGPLTIQNNTPLLMDSHHNVNLNYDLTFSGTHTLSSGSDTYGNKLSTQREKQYTRTIGYVEFGGDCSSELSGWLGNISGWCGRRDRSYSNTTGIVGCRKCCERCVFVCECCGNSHIQHRSHFAFIQLLTSDGWNTHR